MRSCWLVRTINKQSAGESLIMSFHDGDDGDDDDGDDDDDDNK